ncbi:MAG: hypothetical protein GQ477_00575 [Nanohaloarchaea archaeon]|nr:hypothetical protein [Candidatus Nanohaloarchaea archaeon]
MPNFYTAFDTFKRNIPYIFNKFNLNLSSDINEKCSLNNLCYGQFRKLGKEYALEGFSSETESKNGILDLCYDMREIESLYFNFKKNAINQPLNDLFEEVRKNNTSRYHGGGVIFI